VQIDVSGNNAIVTVDDGSSADMDWDVVVWIQRVA
jgi:hypothetical protein